MDGSGQIAAATIIGTGIILNKASRHAMRKHSVKKVEGITESYKNISQDFNGDSLEIFRQPLGKKQYKTHLIWEPSDPQNTETTISQLTRIKEEVEDTELSTILAPFSAINNICQAKGLEPPKPTNKNEWLSKNRFNRSGVINDVAKANDQLCSFTQQELEKFVESLHKDKVNPLDIYMQLLSTLRANHPSLKYYGQATSKSSKLRSVLAKSLASQISSRLGDTDVMSVQSKDGSHKVKQKIHKTGRIPTRNHKSPRISWNLNTGLPLGETQSLLDFVGIKEKDLANLPKIIDKMHPSKAIVACEIGAYMTLQESLKQAPNQRITGLSVSKQIRKSEQADGAEAVRGMQVRIADRVYSRKPPKDSTETKGISIGRYADHRRCIAWLAIGSSFLGGIATAGLAEKYTSSYYDKNVDKIEKRIQAIPSDQELDFDKIYADFPILFQAADELEKTRYKINEIPEKLASNLANLNKFTPEEIKELSKKQLEERSDTRIGDVKPGENRPVWFIESAGGMNSEGYWAQASTNLLNPGGPSPSGTTDISWRNYTLYQQITDENGKYAEVHSKIHETIKSASRLPTLSQANLPTKYLHVQRDISTVIGADGGSWSTDSNFEALEDMTFFDVPVLEDTQISAAQLNGSIPMKVLTLKNGKQVLLGHERFKEGKIEYWLTPKPNSNTIKSIGTISTRDMGIPLKPEKEAWQTELPESLKLKGTERVVAQSTYITSNFRYSLQPFGKSGPKDIIDYSLKVMKSKKANCNTANSLLLLSNTGELNGVSGFNNSNSDEQIKANKMHLSSAESHFWTVDKNGKKHDATPGGASEEDAKFFEENFAESYAKPGETRQKVLIGIGGLLGIAAVGGAGWSSRRRVKKSIKKSLKKHADKKLIDYDDNAKKVAYEIVNHSLFAGRPLTNEEVARINKQSTYPSNSFSLGDNSTTDDLLDELVKDYSAKTVREKVKLSKSISPKETRKTLREAQKISKLKRWQNYKVS